MVDKINNQLVSGEIQISGVATTGICWIRDEISGKLVKIDVGRLLDATVVGKREVRPTRIASFRT